MKTSETQNNAAREAGRKLVARSKKTGRYFDGTNFDQIESNALALRPGTTAEDFRLSWSGEIEVIQIGGARETARIAELEGHQGAIFAIKTQEEKPSLALRIHRGEINRIGAARIYVRERNREGQKSFTVRTPEGKYIGRKVSIECRGPNPCAWIRYCGTQIALVWSRGELAVDCLSAN